MKFRELIALSGLYGGSAVALRLTGAVVFLGLARALPVEDYARFGLIYALQQAFATFALAGIVEAVIGLTKQHQHEVAEQRLFAAAHLAFLAMSVGCGAVAFVLWTSFFRNSPLLVAVSAVGGGFVLALASLQAQLARLREQHVASVLLAVLPHFLGLGFGAAAIAVTGTLSGYFVGFLCGAFGAWLYLELRQYRFGRVATEFSDVQLVLGSMLPYVAVSFLGWLSGYGNNYVLEFIFERAEIAKFTLALTLSSFAQLVSSSLNQVWSPRFYKLVRERENPEELERSNQRFFDLQGWLIGAAGGLVIAFFPLLTNVLGANLVAYQSMTFELLLLFVAYVLLNPWGQCYNYYLANHEGRELMMIVFITSALGLTAWITLMLQLGPIGIYLGFLVQMVLRSMVIVLAAKKRWPIMVAWNGTIGGVLLTVGGYVVTTI